MNGNGNGNRKYIGVGYYFIIGFGEKRGEEPFFGGEIFLCATLNFGFAAAACWTPLGPLELGCSQLLVYTYSQRAAPLVEESEDSTWASNYSSHETIFVLLKSARAKRRKD